MASLQQSGPEISNPSLRDRYLRLAAADKPQTASAHLDPTAKLKKDKSVEDLLNDLKFMP